MPQADERVSLEVTAGQNPPIDVQNTRTGLDVTIGASAPITVTNSELDLAVTVDGQPAPISVTKTPNPDLLITVNGQPNPIVLSTGAGLPGPPGLEGPQGPAGANGRSPLSFLTAAWTPPAPGQSAVASYDYVDWMFIASWVCMEDAYGPGQPAISLSKTWSVTRSHCFGRSVCNERIERVNLRPALSWWRKPKTNLS